MTVTNISNLTVLKSNAGWYIGRQYFDLDFQCHLPYSRDSVEYYPSASDALSALQNKTFTQREWY